MSSYYMQHMLQQYGRQLLTARRPARRRRAMLLAGAKPDPTPEEKRSLMVRRVTGEIVENLLMTGSENPIVLEVKARLNRALGQELIFRYPPGELDMRISRMGPHGEVEVTHEEKAQIMSSLWHIAEQTVNETML